MSIKVMNRVWESSEQEDGTLLVLLALADFADDDGLCWPAIPTIAKKSRLSDRQVQRAIVSLQTAGELRLKSQGTGRASSVYEILLARGESERAVSFMSLAAMAHVWAMHTGLTRTEKLVLLALGDLSDHHGYCWPSVAYIGKHALLSGRRVQEVLRSLEGKGLLRVLHSLGPHGTNYYRIDGLVDPPPLDLNAGPKSITAHTRAYIFFRDNAVCAYCGGDADQIDHVIPLKKGGRNTHENLVAACGPCNKAKKDKDPADYAPPQFSNRGGAVSTLISDGGGELLAPPRTKTAPYPLEPSEKIRDPSERTPVKIKHSPRAYRKDPQTVGAAEWLADHQEAL